MATIVITEGMARNILEGETYFLRFEAFCVDLYRKVDSREYVPTSASHDHGRDGRAVDVKDGEIPPMLCASIRDDALTKAREDAVSLFRHAKPRFVRFCSNQRLNDDTLDAVKKAFRGQCPEVETVEADGLNQIAVLSVRFPDVIQRHYPGELANLRAALSVTEGGDAEVQLTGMRVALTTQLSDDGKKLREDVQWNLVLTVLSDGKARSLEELSRDASQALHLPRCIHSDYLQATVEALAKQGDVECLKSAWRITDKGRDEIRRRTELGAFKLREGQVAVKTVLQELIGAQVDHPTFARLWNVVQDELARLFLNNGIYITNALASVVQGAPVSQHPNLQEAIQNLGQRIANMGSWFSGQPSPRDQELGQAVVDMFHEKTSPAFSWLVDMSLVYVATCALGLEPNAQEQVAARLRELDLILDTDVLLSSLSPGESQHRAVKAVIEGWRRLTGHVYVCESVLEETAHHAWISERDYQETWRILPKMTDAEALRLIENVFVRGFRVESKGQYDRRRWGAYIGMFRGKSNLDYSKILELIKEDGIALMSEEKVTGAMAKQVEDSLVRIKTGESVEQPGGPNVSAEFADKCRRDGRIVELVHRNRQSRQQIGGTCIVVSSSRLLRKACSEFKSVLGDPEPVVPIGAVAYLLTLVPGANLTLGSLRAILFDVDFAPRLQPLERVALRVLQSSDEYFLPFARRGALRNKMREGILSLAKQYGQPIQEVTDKLLHGGEGSVEDLATTIASAVDSITQSRSERQMQQLKDEVRLLRGAK